MKLEVCILAVLAPVFLASCGGTGTGAVPGEEIQMEHARLIRMERHDGYVAVDIVNPWDTTRLLQRYALVDSGAPLPDLEVDVRPVRVPLHSSVVFSAVHHQLLYELGAGDAIGGVCDSEFVLVPDLRRRIVSGEVADCGLNTQPDIERIVAVRPGAVLLSPYENIGHSAIDRAGIPVIECADYMEATPLGRAEWMRFYGLLYGREHEADSLFAVTGRRYDEVRQMAARTSKRPKVLTDRVYGQTWDMPSRQSTTGAFIEDAGGINPFASQGKRGSVPMSPERVLHDARDADVWFVRLYGTLPTLDQLKAERPLYSGFKAWKDGEVYGCDTRRSNLFEEQAFHPHWILRDMTRVLHPEIADSLPSWEGAKTYYDKLVR